jgi:hypothetical protein
VFDPTHVFGLMVTALFPTPGRNWLYKLFVLGAELAAITTTELLKTTPGSDIGVLV